MGKNVFTPQQKIPVPKTLLLFFFKPNISQVPIFIQSPLCLRIS